MEGGEERNGDTRREKTASVMGEKTEASMGVTEGPVPEAPPAVLEGPQLFTRMG